MESGIKCVQNPDVYPVSFATDNHLISTNDHLSTSRAQHGQLAIGKATQPYTPPSLPPTLSRSSQNPPVSFGWRV